MSRLFESKPATRERVPLLVGLYGPSGSGKTFSALRLATGMQKVVGGKIFGIDTEARRMLHYADRFEFDHIDFKPPFGPDDYADAIKHCVDNGARVIVIDSMSHEHEGTGGVLEMHTAEVDRIYNEAVEKARRYNNKEPNRDSGNFTAWKNAKEPRKRLVNTIIQSGASIIACFRSKEKLKILPGGKPPENLGWMPIAGEEFIYEMTVTGLLMPASGGVPTWNPSFDGEKATIKRPVQFEQVLSQFAGKPMCEDIGEAFAQWADGDGGFSDLKRTFAKVQTVEELDKHRAAVAAAHKARNFPKEQLAILTAERDAAMARLKVPADATTNKTTNTARQASAKKPSVEDVAKSTACALETVTLILGFGEMSNEDIVAELYEKQIDMTVELVARVKAAFNK